MFPRNSVSAEREPSESLGSNSAEDVELRVVGVGDVQVVLVVAAPEEGLAPGDPLDVGDVDPARAQELDVLVGEVVADRADDVHVGEHARREREVNRGAAEHAVALPERGPHGVESDGADDGQRHGAASYAAMTIPEPPHAASESFPPIGDYGFLTDCETCALVAPDGAVEWMCTPRFDSPSVFGAMLDRARRGAVASGPRGVRAPIARRYLPGTNVLESDWMSEHGWRRPCALTPWRSSRTSSIDPTATRADMLVRVATCLEGEGDVTLVCEPHFDYGRVRPAWELTGARLRGRAREHRHAPARHATST